MFIFINNLVVTGREWQVRTILGAGESLCAERSKTYQKLLVKKIGLISLDCRCNEKPDIRRLCQAERVIEN